MSERKSAEIKFRCTPTFKAAAQTAADASGQSLTEYIEAAVWAQQNVSIADLQPELAVAALAGLPSLAIGWSKPPVESLREPEAEKRVEYVSTNTDPKDAAQACACRPWEFCTHKAGA